MFDSLFKKKSQDKNNGKLEIKEEYSISKLNQDGKEYLLRFNGWFWNIAGHSNYLYQVGIATTLKTLDHDGLPNSEENQQLTIIEDKIVEELQKDQESLYVGTITGGGIKEFVLYTSDPQKVKERFSKLKNKIKDYNLQINTQEDKDWEVYKTYCPKS